MTTYYHVAPTSQDEQDGQDEQDEKVAHHARALEHTLRSLEVLPLHDMDHHARALEHTLRSL